MDKYGKILGLIIFIISVKLDNLFLIAVYLLGLFVLEYFVIKELPVSNHKLKLTEVMSVIAEGLPSWFYKFIYALSGILLALSISLPFMFKELFSVIIIHITMNTIDKIYIINLYDCCLFRNDNTRFKEFSRWRFQFDLRH